MYLWISILKKKKKKKPLPISLENKNDDACNGWKVCMNGTTSVPKSFPHFVLDKVRLLFVYENNLQCSCLIKFPIKVFHMS